MIFVTSDLHFGHDREFMYGPRGFGSIEESDTTIVGNWNSVVSDDDVVYVLGDIMLNDNEKGLAYWNQLKGKKFMLIGNHDSAVRVELLKECPNTQVLGYADVLQYDGFHFYLSHYPTITSSFEYHRRLKIGLINLCGHTHTKDRFLDAEKGRIYHCELDAHDIKPVAITEIIDDLIQINQRYGSENGE